MDAGILSAVTYGDETSGEENSTCQEKNGKITTEHHKERQNTK